jgi:hypothetical protein
VRGLDPALALGGGVARQSLVVGVAHLVFASSVCEQREKKETRRFSPRPISRPTRTMLVSIIFSTVPRTPSPFMRCHTPLNTARKQHVSVPHLAPRHRRRHRHKGHGGNNKKTAQLPLRSLTLHDAHALHPVPAAAHARVSSFQHKRGIEWASSPSTVCAVVVPAWI